LDKIDIEQIDDILIVHVDGNLTSEYINDITKQFNTIIQNISDSNIKILAVDFGNIYQIDSMGLGYLVKLLKQTISSKKELILYDLNNNVADLMELSTLDRIFNIMNKFRFENEYLHVK